MAMSGYVNHFAQLAANAYTGPWAIDADPVRMMVGVDDVIGCYVAFQGTQDWAQIEADLDIELIHVEDRGDIHRGFHDAIVSKLAAIRAAIGSTPHWFVGHSLGGAEAVIAAALVDPKLVAGVVTFGCPRLCLTSALEQYFNENEIHVSQYVHAQDAVPKVPSWLYHASAPTEVGTYAHWLPNLEDHAMSGYLRATDGL
jgi:hypothetical protein